MVILTCGPSCMCFNEKISFLEVLTFYTTVIFNLDFMIEPFNSPKDEMDRPFLSGWVGVSSFYFFNDILNVFP